MHCPRIEDLPSPPSGKAGSPWTEETPTTTDSERGQNSRQTISIVTPSYNQGNFIEETIRSVLLQGYPNLEYIIMDGGSTDGSVDVIRKYEKYLAFWTTEKDAGAADALRKGFDRATGSILAYLNSDDLYLPGTLLQVEPTFKEANADVVFGNMYWMDEFGKVGLERRQTSFSRIGYIYGGANLSQPSTFWTGEIYRKSGGIDPTFHFAFDMDLFARFMADGAKFTHIKSPLSNFRLHSAQKSDAIHDVGRRETDKIRQRYAQFPVKSLAGKFLRNVGRTQRILSYLAQGDFFWLIGRIPDRLLSHTSKGEPVGPRSKWM